MWKKKLLNNVGIRNDLTKKKLVDKTKTMKNRRHENKSIFRRPKNKFRKIIDKIMQVNIIKKKNRFIFSLLFLCLRKDVSCFFVLIEEKSIYSIRS